MNHPRPFAEGALRFRARQTDRPIKVERWLTSSSRTIVQLSVNLEGERDLVSRFTSGRAWGTIWVTGVIKLIAIC